MHQCSNAAFVGDAMSEARQFRSVVHRLLVTFGRPSESIQNYSRPRAPQPPPRGWWPTAPRRGLGAPRCSRGALPWPWNGTPGALGWVAHITWISPLKSLSPPVAGGIFPQHEVSA